MSLKDIMSHADLTLYPEVALVIFMAVFAAMAWRVSRRDAKDDAYAAGIPLDGNTPSLEGDA